MDVALKQAATDTRRIKQVELLMMAATIARRRGLDDESLSRIEQAVQIAKAGGVQRLLGDAGLSAPPSTATGATSLARSRVRKRPFLQRRPQEADGNFPGSCR